MTNDSDRDKLEALAQKIEKAARAADPVQRIETRDTKEQSRAIVRAAHLVTDFVALVFGTALAGWFIDDQFGTTPWFMLGTMFVGLCGGFWLILRSTSKLGDDTFGDMKE